LGLQHQRHGQREYVKQWWKPEMRDFVWLEKEVKLEDAATAGGKSSASSWGSREHHPPFQVSQDTTHFQYTLAGVSEMHSGFQGLWTGNFQAWFTKKALVGDE